MKYTFLGCLFVGILSTSVSFTASAEGFTYPTIEDDRSGGITFTPMIGVLDLDGGRDVDTDSVIGFGLGYRFSNPYMVEFVYAAADANTKAGADIGDFRQYRLEMLYDIGDVGKFSPYIALGAASTEFGSNATVVDEEGAITAGFGVRYNMSDRLALRGDARYLRGVGDIKGSDVYVGLALQVFLGDTSKPQPQPKPEQPVALVKPEPAEPSFDQRCNEAGGFVSAGNCVKKSVSTDTVTLSVEFAFNSSVVTSDYMPEIGKLAAFMQKYPSVTIEVGGHTDSIGSEKHNQSLSQRRVDEVVRLLSANYGVESSRLTAIGFGESQAIASNILEAGRAVNRRVEALITVEVEEMLSVDVK
ncbi:MAG: OOP family OmpA-OmpF porin [Candidatus Endobugula sp.]|jgi:OOP family OmpA-OmpF porin